MKKRKYYIQSDLIDLIVRDALRDDLSCLLAQLKEKRIHPDDLENNRRYAEAIKVLQEYYGK